MSETMLSIGVMDRAADGWTAGAELTRGQVATLLSAIRSGGARASVTVITHNAGGFRLPASVRDEAVRVLAPFSAGWLSPRRRLVRRALEWTGRWRDPRAGDWRRWAEAAGLDVVLSFVPWDWWFPCGIATCCSIPDFQHLHLPEYFDEKGLRDRDELCRDEAEKTDLAILHSEDVVADFRRFAPHCAHKARLFRFPSLFCFADPSPVPDAGKILERYGIEPGFLLVMNQFWAHKNHRLVLEAMSIAASRGRCPQVVMIGQTSDVRDPAGRAFSNLLGRVAELRLEGRVKLLGFVPPDVRDVLLRCCRALVQPSRFEGWNTANEDAKALGRPILVSDLPVHREQVPEAWGFFGVDDAEGLAGLLAAAAAMPPGPDMAREEACRRAARQRMLSEGGSLIGYCREAAALAKGRARTAR